MTKIEEIKRRILLKTQLIDLTKLEIRALTARLKIEKESNEMENKEVTE